MIDLERQLTASNNRNDNAFGNAGVTININDDIRSVKTFSRVSNHEVTDSPKEKRGPSFLEAPQHPHVGAIKLIPTLT
jgi:hypothetical protein